LQPVAVALIAFVCFFGAGLAGLWIRPHQEHATDGSRDAVRLVQTLLTGMTAAAIGMLLASSSGRFREQETTVADLASKVLLLDMVLREYGDAAQPVRRALIERTERARNDISAAAKVDIAKATPLLEWILPIEPSTPREVFLHSQMARLAMEITQQRAQLMTRENAYGIQPAMMVLLIVWLTVLFFATGLYAPSNRTIIAAMGIGAVAFSSALLLVLEQDRPFHGLLPVSAAPLDEALRAIRNH
jgi:hypothetical protein